MRKSCNNKHEQIGLASLHRILVRALQKQKGKWQIGKYTENIANPFATSLSLAIILSPGVDDFRLCNHYNANSNTAKYFPFLASEHIFICFGRFSIVLCDNYTLTLSWTLFLAFPGNWYPIDFIVGILLRKNSNSSQGKGWKVNRICIGEKGIKNICTAKGLSEGKISPQFPQGSSLSANRIEMKSIGDFFC